MNRHRADVPLRAPRVMIVANYTADVPTSNNRFNDLARRFAARGAEVELVTSRFSHARKVMHTEELGQSGYTITRLDEPGYARNISAARLRSQAAFAREVARHLDALPQRPDLILAATPPPGVAEACGRYARRTGTPFAIDIQDLWPEAFAMVVRAPWAVDLAFSRMRRRSRAAYRSADRIIGVSATYIDAAVRDGADPQRTRVVHLGTDLRSFDERAAAPIPPAFAGTGPVTQPVIGYAGGLSDSYDLPLVIDALALLARTPGAPPAPTLIVMGEGARRADFEEHARGTGLDIRFTGALPYAEMVRTLAACRIAVNPIVPGSAGSVLNKAGDYAAAGLPVVNSQESAEYRGLLERYGAGISCDPQDPQQIATAFQHLAEEPQRCAAMGAGSRRMAEEIFDRSVTYEAMIEDLLSLTRERPGP